MNQEELNELQKKYLTLIKEAESKSNEPSYESHDKAKELREESREIIEKLKVNGYDIKEGELIKIEKRRLFTTRPGIRSSNVEDYYLENVLKDKEEYDFNNSIEDLLESNLNQDSYLFKVKELIPNSEGREVVYEERDIDKTTKKRVIKSYEDFINDRINKLQEEIELVKSPNYWSKDENNNLINKENKEFKLIENYSYLYNKTLDWKQKDDRYNILIEGFEEQKEFMKKQVIDCENMIKLLQNNINKLVKENKNKNTQKV